MPIENQTTTLVYQLETIPTQNYSFAIPEKFMSNNLTIAVGSKNPVKIESARAGFQAMFPENIFSAEGYDVASGVSDQPMSSQETLQGATNRARALRELNPTADFFVGIEGGIETINDTLFASAWIVVIDRGGTSTLGRSGAFPLPPGVKRLVDSGVELGHANDKVFEQHNSKQQGGAVASLTGGVITRHSLYEHAMALALATFKHPELFSS